MTIQTSKMSFDAASFKCTESPIILDDLRIGEFYDARLEVEGWNEPGFDDSGWRAPIKAETPRGECRISDIDPILPAYELTPVSITESRISIFPNTRDNLPKIPIPVSIHCTPKIIPVCHASSQ